MRIACTDADRTLRKHGPIATDRQLLTVSLRRPRQASTSAAAYWVPAYAGTTGVGSSRDTNMTPRSRGSMSPRFASTLSLKTEGAGNAGCLLHPRSRVQLCAKNTHTSIQEQPEHSGIPCAMALRLISCSPRRTALLPPSFPRSVPLGNLTPAPRRQDHTTSPYASATLVRRDISVHRIPPHVRDDREAPFIRRETRGNMPLICPTARAEYFCWRDGQTFE